MRNAVARSRKSSGEIAGRRRSPGASPRLTERLSKFQPASVVFSPYRQRRPMRASPCKRRWWHQHGFMRKGVPASQSMGTQHTARRGRRLSDTPDVSGDSAFGLCYTCYRREKRAQKRKTHMHAQGQQKEQIRLTKLYSQMMTDGCCSPTCRLFPGS